MDYRLLSNNNNNYPTHHHWFPKMCSCLESGNLGLANFPSGQGRSYKRLGSGPTLFDLSEFMQRTRRSDLSQDETIDDERQAEIIFHNTDLTWTTIVVEKNLRTMDLCELLKVKNRASGMDWSIIETWTDLGIERTLEDHEDILVVYKEMELFASHHERRFFFQRDFIKYEFFINPKQFFPPDMVALPNFEERNFMSSFESKLKDHLMRNDMECPNVFSCVWLRGNNSHIWKKAYMLLQDRKLYIVKKPPTATSSKRPMDNEQAVPFAHLSDYHVYKIPNAKKYFNAPFEWGACLRPSSNAEAEDTEAGVPGLKVIAFNSEKSRTCWLTAMRFAKYGKQLRENYRAFKNKQCEQNEASSPKEQYRAYNVSSESFRSRVAMDFTGSVGRIVEDPKEARDIAESEGLLWRRRWRPFSRSPPGCAVSRKHALDDGVHVLKPWFHRDVNRDTAASLVREHGTVDGVFLVRESKSYPGAFVLTYKYGDKVIHAQIQPTVDERGNGCLYTLDKGVTKFYDLIQLVDFYQLNAGSLPTRLTHYVGNGLATSPETESSSPSPSPSSTKPSHSPRKMDSKNPRS
ncbi:growth factor receptor-bound protein 14 isoform X1 [Fopius arisanus]|uniref:GRB14_0 protein n=1 Tax=Fopius arisanus TaxID=64838 RepID=A0A0C9RCF1_9HYME|nr:PREDICTED: growth factor receptor-bound protein 14-like isoform X1 [Fopius arisanus]